jgi:hypothetical protein
VRSNPAPITSTSTIASSSRLRSAEATDPLSRQMRATHNSRRKKRLCCQATPSLPRHHASSSKHACPARCRVLRFGDDQTQEGRLDAAPEVGVCDAVC